MPAALIAKICQAGINVKRIEEHMRDNGERLEKVEGKYVFSEEMLYMVMIADFKDYSLCSERAAISKD